MCQSQEIGESSVQTNIRDSNSYLLNFQFFGQKLSIYWIKNESPKQLYFLIEFSSISLEKTHGDFIRCRHFELSGFLEKDLLPFRIELRLVRGGLGLVEEAYELLLFDSLVTLGRLYHDCWCLLSLCLFVGISRVKESAPTLAGH